MAPEFKNHMISFRLSAEEYDRLRSVCFLRGIRSVSELARAAINMLADDSSRAPREVLEARLTELEGRVHILSLELKRCNRTAQLIETDAPGVTE
jgi:hypothetical protein